MESRRARKQGHQRQDRTAIDIDQFLSAKDLAAMFHVRRSRAYEILHCLPTVRVGRSVRVSRRRLEEWVDRQAGEESGGAVD